MYSYIEITFEDLVEIAKKKLAKSGLPRPELIDHFEICQLSESELADHFENCRKEEGTPVSKKDQVILSMWGFPVDYGVLNMLQVENAENGVVLKRKVDGKYWKDRFAENDVDANGEYNGPKTEWVFDKNEATIFDDKEDAIDDFEAWLKESM